METNSSDPIAQIEVRIYALQTSFLSLQEQLKTTENSAERHLDEFALRLIDIIDMIEAAKPTMDLHKDPDSLEQRIIRKIEKKMLDILKRMQVYEIVLKDGQIEPGKARVLESRSASGGMPPNTVIEVCRKGYERGDKVLRPADLIM